MRSKLRKLSAGFVAVVLVGAMVLTGTLAWNHASEMALNEAGDSVNPGGRLHDDFNGENKDIYVENFSDPENGGVPIFARIRLYEYMEIGEGAGILSTENGTNNATPLVSTANINDKSSWTPHKPTASVLECAGGDSLHFHDYWSWEMGGKTVYMPTFNMDKDSLVADINGTWAGDDGDRSDDSDAYSDYHEYELGETKTVDGVTHTAVETLDAQVMTMQQWKDDDAKLGNYWVIDTDGWAYWANPIQPGTATGLLLSNIKQIRMPDNTWYYGIHVEAQFATAGNWGQDDSTGFYKDPDAVPSADGLYLLNKAAGMLPEVVGLNITEGSFFYAPVNSTTALTAEVAMRFPSGDPAETAVTWTISPETSSFRNGTFYPTGDMLGKTYTVTVTSSFDPDYYDSVEIIIIPSDAKGVVEGADGERYLTYGDNTFKLITPAAEGSDAAAFADSFICGGPDGKPGNSDDIHNITVEETPVGIYGTKFIGPNSDGGYLAAGEDKLLGTEDDVMLFGNPWPENVKVPTVTISGATSMDVGTSIDLDATADPVANTPITWTLVGDYADGTSVNADGVVFVALTETQQTVTVKARAENLGGAEDTHEVTIYTPEITISDPSTANAGIAGKGLTKQLNATVSNGANGNSYSIAWTVTGSNLGSTTISSTGLISVDFAVPDNTVLTVTATLDNGANNSMEITVQDYITIDGIAWWLVAQDEEDINGNGVENDILLLHKNGVDFFSDLSEPSINNCWPNSKLIRPYFKDTFLPNLGKLKTAAIETTIHTRTVADDENSVIETPDKIFFLSEADYYGTINGSTPSTDEYTYNGAKLDFAPDMLKVAYDAEVLRNPQFDQFNQTSGYWAYRNSTGRVLAEDAGSVVTWGMKPAMWVNPTVVLD